MTISPQIDFCCFRSATHIALTQFYKLGTFFTAMMPLMSSFCCLKIGDIYVLYRSRDMANYQLQVGNRWTAGLCLGSTIFYSVFNNFPSVYYSTCCMHAMDVVSAVCEPPCMNGGYCSGPNQCSCTLGYIGRHCQIRKYIHDVAKHS